MSNSLSFKNEILESQNLQFVNANLNCLISIGNNLNTEIYLPGETRDAHKMLNLFIDSGGIAFLIFVSTSAKHEKIQQNKKLLQYINTLKIQELHSQSKALVNYQQFKQSYTQENNPQTFKISVKQESFKMQNNNSPIQPSTTKSRTRQIVLSPIHKQHDNPLTFIETTCKISIDSLIEIIKNQLSILGKNQQLEKKYSAIKQNNQLSEIKEYPKLHRLPTYKISTKKHQVIDPNNQTQSQFNSKLHNIKSQSKDKRMTFYGESKRFLNRNESASLNVKLEPLKKLHQNTSLINKNLNMQQKKKLQAIKLSDEDQQIRNISLDRIKPSDFRTNRSARKSQKLIPLKDEVL